MEQKISLQTKTNFELTPEELHRMFLAMSLFQYRFERKVDYNERKLLKILHKDFRDFLDETSSLLEANPNNHNINKLHYFISKYHTFLKREVEAFI